MERDIWDVGHYGRDGSQDRRKEASGAVGRQTRVARSPGMSEGAGRKAV